MFNIDDNIIPNKPTIQYQEFNCCRCGSSNRFIKPVSFIDYKEENKYLKNRFNDYIHELNTIIEYTYKEYGLNPFRDKLIDELSKLRDKYA